MISRITQIVAGVAECTESPDAVIKTVDVIRKYEERIPERFIVLLISASLKDEANKTGNSLAVTLLADALENDEVLEVLKGYYQQEWIHPRNIPNKVLSLINKIAQETKSPARVQEFVGLAGFYLKQIEKKPRENFKIQHVYTVLSDIIKEEGSKANISGYIDLAYKFDQRIEKDYRFEEKLFSGMRWGLLEQGYATAEFIDFINYFGDLQGIEEIIERTIDSVRNQTWQCRQLMPWLESIQFYMKDTLEHYQEKSEVKDIAKYMINTALEIKKLPGGVLDDGYSGRKELFKSKCQEYLATLEKN